MRFIFTFLILDALKWWFLSHLEKEAFWLVNGTIEHHKVNLIVQFVHLIFFFIKILNYQTKSKFLTTFLNLKAKVIEISCISSNFLLKKFHFCLECLGSSHPSQPDTAASLTHRRALAFCKIFSQLDQHMNKTTQSRFCGGLSSKNWCPALLFSVRRVYSKNWAPAKSTK